MTDDDDRKRLSRAEAEQRELDDLLAGFDRPGRTPRAPPVRDFVEYFDTPRSPGVVQATRGDRPADAGSRPPGPNGAASSPKRASTTVVIPRGQRSARAWAPWAALLLAMPIAGGVVASLALDRTDHPPTAPERAAASPLPSATTATPEAADPRAPSSADLTPSSSPASPDEGESARGAAPAPPSAAATSTARSPADARSADPRGDFIRSF